jgi:hypothetical protein
LSDIKPSSATGKKTSAAAERAIESRPHDSGGLSAPLSAALPGSGETELVPRQAVPHPAAAAFIARRRVLIAAAGLTALTAFLFSYLLA